MIADDHDLARAGLRGLLEGEHGLQVVGEAADGREAVALCQRLQPDVVLMDLRMPGLDGLAATRAIKEQSPATSIVVVTMHENPDYLLGALKAGASGYVLKGASKREIVTAIRQVLRGGSPLAPDLAGQLLGRLATQAVGRARLPAERLTTREQEVLRLLARGQTNRDIARELAVSVSTIKAHVEHIIAKLGVSDRTEAAVRAVELGLLNAGGAPLLTRQARTRRKQGASEES